MLRLTPGHPARIAAAALLLTGGFSAGLRHAHPGGDHAHRHHHDDHHGLGVAEADLHDQHVLPRPAPAAHDARTAWQAAPMHLHVYFLGFQCTLPAPDQHGEAPDDGAPDHGATLIRLLGPDVPGTRGSAFPLAFDSPADATGTAVSPPPAPRPHSGENRAPVRPLCDSARHERSGVRRA